MFSYIYFTNFENVRMSSLNVIFIVNLPKRWHELTHVHHELTISNSNNLDNSTQEPDDSTITNVTHADAVVETAVLNRDAVCFSNRLLHEGFVILEPTSNCVISAADKTEISWPPTFRLHHFASKDKVN